MFSEKGIENFYRVVKNQVKFPEFHVFFSLMIIYTVKQNLSSNEYKKMITS